VLVGNAPEPLPLPSTRGSAKPIARFIDESDYVIRMNDIKNHASPWIGRRTDMLAMCNTGVPGRRYATGKPIRFDHIDPPKEILWTLPATELAIAGLFNRDDVYRGHDFAEAITEHQSWSQLPSHRISDGLAWRLTLRLAYLARKPCIASTGIRTILYALQSPRFGQYKKFFIGFGFKGWRGHAYEAERKLVDSLVGQGMLVAPQLNGLDS
jgi:hypothetical protein